MQVAFNTRNHSLMLEPRIYAQFDGNSRQYYNINTYLYKYKYAAGYGY